jgi:hypothetical protein
MKWFLPIVLLLSGTVVAQVQQETRGSIRGIVVDEKGNPVKGATVWPGDIRRWTGRLPPPAHTDQTGHFIIEGLEFSEYSIIAYDEDEDYPYLDGTWLLFYKQPVRATVELTQGQPIATVEMRVGPKTGALVGDITDAIQRHACEMLAPGSRPFLLPTSIQPIRRRRATSSWCLPMPLSL